VHTARRIAGAVPVPVHRCGPVVADPLGTVAPGDLDADDIIAIPATPHPGGGNLRLLRVSATGAGRYRLLLDTDGGPQSWPAQPTDAPQCVTVWRPVPHHCHPWHHH
jgi:hypothetical protein